MEKLMNANSARLSSLRVNEKKMSMELIDIKSRIEKAISQGYYGVFVGSISTETKDILKGLGYKIEPDGDPRDPGYSINW